MAAADTKEVVVVQHKSKKTESAMLKLLTSGTVTVVFEAVGGGHYLEMLKILKQTSNDNYFTITKRMTAQKGIIGVLDGFMPWGFIQALVKGSSFGFGHALCRKGLHHVHSLDEYDWLREILSGGGGGVVQGVIMSPTLLLKTRVMTDPRFRATGGFFETSYHSLKLGKELIETEGGLMSLTKGMGVFSFKRFCDWTTRYGFCVLVEQMYKQQKYRNFENVYDLKLSKPEQMACSLAGGTLSALATIPIDVMVATIQQADKKGEKVSVVKIFRTQLNEKGVKGVMQLSTRGLVARVSHVALTVMLMKTMSSWLYEVITR